MSQDVFYLLVCAGGVLGCLFSMILLLRKKNIAGVLLGVYTLLLSISFIEPVTKYLSQEMRSVTAVVIGTASFMLGPSLYLYCKHSVMNIQKWSRVYIFHFLPAGFIFLMMAYPIIVPQTASNDTIDILVYGFFVMYLITYSVESLLMVLRKRKSADVRHREGIQSAFLLFLVIASLILFSFSTLYTLMGFALNNGFIIGIQTMIFLIIMGTALLNPETTPSATFMRRR
jgi:hypothetical protein